MGQSIHASVKAMLGRYELPDKPVPRYFHATELEGGAFPFNRLDDTQRHALRMEATNLTVSSGIIGIGSGVRAGPRFRSSQLRRVPRPCRPSLWGSLRLFSSQTASERHHRRRTRPMRQ